MHVAKKALIGSIAIVVGLTNGAVAGGLPDVLGIQLGMPAREAHAKLQAQIPKNKIQVMSTNLPTIDKPVITTFSSVPAEQIMMGMEGDQVTVDVTLPPNKQTVWRVDRQHYFPGKGIPKTTLLSSLREKYGRETLTNIQQGKPAPNDSQIISLLWLYDEHGQPAPLPGPPGSKAPDLATTLTLSTCVGLGNDTNMGMLEVYMDLYKGKNAQSNWCYSSYTAVYATVMESNPAELYSQMRLVTVNVPFAARAAEATMKWKKDIAEGQHRQDLEKAKQQEKPRL